MIIYSINKIRSVTLILEDLLTATLQTSHIQMMMFSTDSSHYLISYFIFIIKQWKISSGLLAVLLTGNEIIWKVIFFSHAHVYLRLGVSKVAVLHLNSTWKEYTGNYSMQHMQTVRKIKSKCVIELGPCLRYVYNFSHIQETFPNAGTTRYFQSGNWHRF